MGGTCPWDSPNAQFLSNPNLTNTFRVHTNLGRVIGTKEQTTVRVIVGFDGKVINESINTGGFNEMRRLLIL